MCQGPFGQQWSVSPQSNRHLLLKYWQASLPFSLCICCSASLSLASFQDHPPLHWPLRDWDWGLFFWLNKDFLVDTLTWPVVFGEGL